VSVLGARFQSGQSPPWQFNPTIVLIRLSHLQSKRWLIPDAVQQLINDPSSHITSGKYSHNDLSEATRRFAMLYLGQEAYYPRPHQLGLYEPFKASYLRTLEGILLALKPEPDHEREQWDSARKQVLRAGQVFFERYEELDAEKMARQGRSGR
jgi:hypothetical protein